MAESISIREKLHQYIEVADDDKIQAIYTLIENDINYHFNADEIRAFYNRRNRHLNKTSKSYTLEEPLSEIKNSKK